MTTHRVTVQGAPGPSPVERARGRGAFRERRGDQLSGTSRRARRWLNVAAARRLPCLVRRKRADHPALLASRFRQTPDLHSHGHGPGPSRGQGRHGGRRRIQRAPPLPVYRGARLRRPGPPARPGRRSAYGSIRPLPYDRGGLKPLSVACGPPPKALASVTGTTPHGYRACSFAGIRRRARPCVRNGDHRPVGGGVLEVTDGSAFGPHPGVCTEWRGAHSAAPGGRWPRIRRRGTVARERGGSSGPRAGC